MSLNTARIKFRDQGYSSSIYVSAPNFGEGTIIEGDFYKEQVSTVESMTNRKTNKMLCGCLAIAIAVTFVSYYISMNYEAKLNNLDNEIVRLNAENQDLQAELDRYKSFNNVDTKIGEFNLLQKAERVIEVTALNTAGKELNKHVKTASNHFDWAIGY
jgi:outer membrane murein-binding lipoprotein Lpp